MVTDSGRNRQSFLRKKLKKIKNDLNASSFKMSL
jgi:hypothetical protein